MIEGVGGQEGKKRKEGLEEREAIVALPVLAIVISQCSIAFSFSDLSFSPPTVFLLSPNFVPFLPFP